MKLMRLLAARNSSSSFEAWDAVSPIDGRYQAANLPLKNHFSEAALMKYRIQVQGKWLLHLTETQLIPTDPTLSIQGLKAQLEGLVTNFNGASASRIKQIESVTNHDLKSVEYFIKENITGYKQWVHFCCTSEDINNLAYTLMLKDALNQIMLPNLSSIQSNLKTKAKSWSNYAMMGRTHGQSATPTTIGKEYANFAYRIASQVSHIRNASLLLSGKFNGAVGNYNAHCFSYPQQDWPLVSKQFIQKRLGLAFNPYTTQIQPHDSLARLCAQLSHCNTILIGLCRDSWQYISKGYLKQSTKKGEVGSSTMPHKVNPIDFENCEGNLGVANALLEHFRAKLPISRQQRDLSDSTVLRNQGSALGYSLTGYKSLIKGLSKVEPNHERMALELDQHYEVITEAIQTELRKIGFPEPYQLLKELSREQAFTEETKTALLKRLEGKIPMESYQKIKDLKPTEYLGVAAKLAKQI